MIARTWRGWTTPENADAYQALLTDEILPRIDAVEGYRGSYVLRRDGAEEVEFFTVITFADLDAVKEFAGEEHADAVVPPEARVLLLRHDERSRHYDIVHEPS